MPHNSTTTTHAANAAITESAAAGTAIACGEKTNNNMLGLAPNGERLESIAELAKKNGRKVGIISSVTINHATPAAFYAHNGHRNNLYDIGLDLIKSDFDYFGGGGIAQHDDKTAKQYRGDIYTLAKEADYTVCRTGKEIRALKPGAGKVIALDLDCPKNSFDDNESLALLYAIDAGGLGVLRLPDFTKQAIELLDNPNGFFIMVEGGKIDWACHNNDAGAAIGDIIEFDNAVEVAFEFAKKKPGEVLIVVTGDHETGGLTLAPQNHIELLAKQKVSFDALVWRFGFYQGMVGERASFEFYKKEVSESTGLVFSETEEWKPGNLVLTPAEVKELEASFEVSIKVFRDEMQTKEDFEKKRGDLEKFAKTVIHILNNKAGVTWKSGDHTALPVQTSTWGNQAEEMAKGIKDNTDISKQLKQAVRALP
jgi:alkaline phosphatase